MLFPVLFLHSVTHEMKIIDLSHPLKRNDLQNLSLTNTFCPTVQTANSNNIEKSGFVFIQAAFESHFNIP